MYICLAVPSKLSQRFSMLGQRFMRGGSVYVAEYTFLSLSLLFIQDHLISILIAPSPVLQPREHTRLYVSRSVISVASFPYSMEEYAVTERLKSRVDERKRVVVVRLLFFSFLLVM